MKQLHATLHCFLRFLKHLKPLTGLKKYQIFCLQEIISAVDIRKPLMQAGDAGCFMQR
jgi:hypothetical protein